jgi:hypothetical protein
LLLMNDESVEGLMKKVPEALGRGTADAGSDR